jgi:hypothetical protein
MMKESPHTHIAPGRAGSSARRSGNEIFSSRLHLHLLACLAIFLACHSAPPIGAIRTNSRARLGKW